MVGGSKAPFFLQKSMVGLVNAGVAAVGDDGEGVLLFALGVPHLAGGADHRGHGGIDDDVAGDVEVGDALVGIHHRDGGAVGVGGLDVGLDLGLLVGREALDFCDEVAEAVVEIDAEFLDDGGVLGDEVLEEDSHGVAEDDRVGDLHHRGLQVEGEEDAVLLRLGDLLVEEGDEGLLAHERGVEDFAGLERSLLLEDLDRCRRLPTNSIFTLVAAGTVTDFSLEKKSSLPIVPTVVFESADHAPMECGCLRAYSLTALGARRSELPSRRTGLTALPLTLS